ncbi:MAG: M48 family metallopeptidase [Muribaculum sp.]|nr:M48 family metallopeptidase [Muribaculum sp.]
MNSLAKYRRKIMWMQTFVVASLFLMAIVCIGLSIFCINLAEDYRNSKFLVVAIVPLLYCIGSLFIFFTHKTPQPKGLVVDKSVAPLLLDYIAEVGKRMNSPFQINSVLLTTGNSIYVYQQPSLMNFLKPQKPTLVVGVPLMNSMSKEEFGAVLAHEFAHLSQPLTFYKAYLAKISNATVSIGFVGKGMAWGAGLSIYTFPTKLIGKLFSLLYDNFFNANAVEHEELERRMEFEADAIAAKEFGHGYLLRGLVKSCLLKRRHEVCRHFLIPIISSQGKSVDYQTLFLASDAFFQKFDGYSISKDGYLDIIDEELFLKSLDCESQLIIERINRIASLTGLNEDIYGGSNNILPLKVISRINDIITLRYFNDNTPSIKADEIDALLTSLSIGVFGEAQTLSDVEAIIQEIQKEVSMEEVIVPVVMPTYASPSCDIVPTPVVASPSDVIFTTDEKHCPVCGKEIDEFVKVCPFCKEVIAE